MLTKLTEQGMGYQIVDIKMKNGKGRKEKIVTNSIYLQLDKNELLEPNDIEAITLHKLHITQHKRFVPYDTHPNPSLSLRTSFMLGTNGNVPQLEVVL
ncbi:MAG: hypothetical protein Q8P28_05030 [Deltaproteobacteria bacterium]|nr:hypothetical protein [Deltaproteobacteria bacterium]